MQVHCPDPLILSGAKSGSRSGELLRHIIHSVIDVAQMVGVGDLSRFNKMFTKYAGMPLTAYRKLAAKRSEKSK